MESYRMKIHEYQARDLLSRAGVPVPASRVVDSADAARDAYKAIVAGGGSTTQVVKAQVFAGGRGKAGFVKLVKNEQEAHDAAWFMLTNRMVSVQTGPEGVSPAKLLIAAAVDIAHEYYVGITLDRLRGTATVIASAEGGVEIEKVAHERPEAIIKEPLHPLLGLQPFQARRVARKLGFTGKQAGTVAALLGNLAKVFLSYDCSIAEINPLVVTKDGQIQAIDATINFDDSALFRHPDIAALFDPTEVDALEVRATKANLNYIKLDGTIGCLVNGAGLAMATMDVIQLNGGTPANFLDVGGGVKAEGAIEAFRILLSDPKVKGVLVNIFGGIAKCDLIAEALITAGKEVGFKIPVVVRLEGTNVEKAREMLALAQNKLPTLQIAVDLNDAARKIVAATRA
ncbi:MAG: ADP-forming succinate--CoA ligase subunit beta [Phycisphaerae bacterium]